MYNVTASDCRPRGGRAPTGTRRATRSSSSPAPHPAGVRADTTGRCPSTPPAPMAAGCASPTRRSSSTTASAKSSSSCSCSGTRSRSTATPKTRSRSASRRRARQRRR
ncbi:uncharacterized protein LOC100277529 [Zea mays]|uniref:Uncharacterized protein n=1 Tax=Zea mays TaxID=4577 RepID=A0A804P2W1_MAIZE|nr:uncharacterized protein LOC100277529 [Zea mays]